MWAGLLLRNYGQMLILQSPEHVYEPTLKEENDMEIRIRAIY